MSNISDSKYNTYYKRYNDNLVIVNSLNTERIIGSDQKLSSYMLCTSIFMNNNRIVSIGTNKHKTHPLFQKLGYLKNYSKSYCQFNKRSRPVHSELDAYIRLIRNNITEYNTIYIYRGLNSNLPSMPCLSCSSWLRKIRGLVVCFIDNNGKFVCINSSDLKGHINMWLKATKNDNKEIL